MMTFAAQVDWPLDDALRYPAKMIDEFPFERPLPDSEPDGHGEPPRACWKEPMGVIGAIVPWNYPVEVTLNKIGPILATGNTVVLKPAPDTPWNATRLGRLVAEKTDIPAGVVNVVTSSDHLVGEELTLSPDGRHDLVHRARRPPGKRIMEKGAADAQAGLPRARRQVGHDRLRRRRLRLRGARGRPWCACTRGQGCAMQTRMLLPRSRYDEGVELITAAMRHGPLRRPDRRRGAHGPTRERPPARPCARLHREGAGGGGQAGRRRRPARAPAQGLVRGAHPLRRRGQLHDHRAGGDLRSRALRHPVRGRRRRRAHRQRVQLRALRRRVLGVRGPGHRHRPPDPDRVHQRQRRHVVRGGLALRGLQGQRHRPPVRHRGVRAIPRDEGHRLARGLS